MAQNGSENGSEGCSEAPEADWSHSRPGNFWFVPSSNPNHVSELLDLVFGAPGADFERFLRFQTAPETSFLDS